MTRLTVAGLTVEWRTIGVAVVIYGGFSLLTWYYHDLPWWLVLPLGAFVVAWHGSLQHEVVHGHPTSSSLLNEALVFPNLWLWMPFRTYRFLHLAHHRDASLTDPREDPESYYVTASGWARSGPLLRALYWWRNTCLGRLLVGPIFSLAALMQREAALLARRDFGALAPWLPHACGVALVFAWVWGVCGIPVLEYLLLFAYPGLSLTLLRSFLEHQARDQAGERTAIVEAGPLFSLLFLNNNLHALHHRMPGVPWYALPAEYRMRKQELLAENGGYLYRGYAEVIARYLLWPKEPILHPAEAFVPEPPRPAAAPPLTQTA